MASLMLPLSLVAQHASHVQGAARAVPVTRIVDVHATLTNKCSGGGGVVGVVGGSRSIVRVRQRPWRHVIQALGFDESDGTGAGGVDSGDEVDDDDDDRTSLGLTGTSSQLVSNGDGEISDSCIVDEGEEASSEERRHGKGSTGRSSWMGSMESIFREVESTHLRLCNRVKSSISSSIPMIRSSLFSILPRGVLTDSNLNQGDVKVVIPSNEIVRPTSGDLEFPEEDGDLHLVAIEVPPDRSELQEIRILRHDVQQNGAMSSDSSDHGVTSTMLPSSGSLEQPQERSWVASDIPLQDSTTPKHDGQKNLAMSVNAADSADDDDVTSMMLPTSGVSKQLQEYCEIPRAANEISVQGITIPSLDVQEIAAIPVDTLYSDGLTSLASSIELEQTQKDDELLSTEIPQVSQNGSTLQDSMTPKLDVPKSLIIPIEMSYNDDGVARSTQTEVKFDKDANAALITLTSMVRGREIENLSFSTDQDNQRAVILTFQALRRACAILEGQVAAFSMACGRENSKESEMNVNVRQDYDIKEHKEILLQLREGKVVESIELRKGYGATPFRPVYVMKLAHRNKKLSRALFKPFVPGDAHCRWRGASPDWLAYKIGQLLGMDMVPPSIMRKGLQVGDKKYPLGTLIFFVSDVHPLTRSGPEEWGAESAAAFVSNVHILDALVGNAPRKSHLILEGMHWNTLGKRCPVLLDHPMGAATGKLHYMSSLHNNVTDVRTVSPQRLRSLENLDIPMLKESLSGHVTDEEVNAILHRRDEVVSYFYATSLPV